MLHGFSANTLFILHAMKDVCCICKTRTSKRFTATKSFKELIQLCFKVEREGHICDTCKGCIYSFRQSKSNPRDFSWRVDCRLGKQSLRKTTNRKANLRNQRPGSVSLQESQQNAYLQLLTCDVTLQILTYLTPQSLISFAKTSKSNFSLATCSWLWKKCFSRTFGVSVSKCYSSLTLSENDSKFNWFHVYKLASQVVAKSSHLLSQSKYQLLSLGETNDDLFKRNQELLTSLETKDNILSSLLEGQGTVTPLEETIFRRVVRKKISSSTNGQIYAKNKHGRPITLSVVRTPEIPSNVASKSTVRSRSKDIERKIESSTATSKQDNAQKTEAMNAQKTSMIKRDGKNFSICAKDAGLVVGCKFTVEQAAALKKEMPWGLWRLVKRSLKAVSGMDIIGSEVKLREFIKKENLEYECGVFETKGNKKVTFVRVTSVRQALLALFNGLNAHGEISTIPNIQENHMLVLITGDKGSAQTKLMMTLLNSTNQHSQKRAKMLAIFEGDKDTRECMEKASMHFIEDHCIKYYNEFNIRNT